MKNTLVSLAFLGSLALLLGPPAQADCTIGVANGVVTQDARPLLFKSRMATTPGFNLVDRDDTGTYTYVGVRSSSDTNVNMGLNSAGLSMGNSLVDGLGGNFAFTAFCLANGADVPGIPWDPAYVATVSGCFPFMDATGNTVLY